MLRTAQWAKIVLLKFIDLSNLGFKLSKQQLIRLLHVEQQLLHNVDNVI